MRTFFLILIFSCRHFLLLAQESLSYSEPLSFDPEFKFSIAGKFGEHIHVWKTLGNSGFIAVGSKKKPITTIYIYSTSMKLVKQKDIVLDGYESGAVGVSFFVSSDFYYVIIYYSNDGSSLPRKLLRVNENGDYTEANLEDFTSFNEKQLPQKPRIIIHRNSFMTGPDTSMSRLMSLTRTYMTDDEVFSTRESPVWVCTTCKLNIEEKGIADSSTYYSLFMGKIDTNFIDISGKIKFARIDDPDYRNKIFYSLAKANLLGNHLCLISVGYQTATKYVSSYWNMRFGDAPTRPMPMRTTVDYLEPVILRIIELDRNMHLILDTSISVNSPYSKLLLENAFYSKKGNRFDLLCAQQFSKKSNGIKHFSIEDGFVREEDVQVQPRNKYKLLDTKRLDDNSFMIPYMKGTRLGFVKWVKANPD